MTAIRYARAGGPPDDWSELHVIDLAAGREVSQVEEVNADEGWLLRWAGDEPTVCSGDPPCPHCDGAKPHNHFRVERIEGKYEIVR